jgi:hypothetical protein
VNVPPDATHEVGLPVAVHPRFAEDPDEIAIEPVLPFAVRVTTGAGGGRPATFTTTESVPVPLLFEHEITYVLDAESVPVDSVPPPTLLLPDQSLDAVHAVGLPEVVQARVAEFPNEIVVEPPTPFAVMSTVGGGIGADTFTTTESVPVPLLFEHEITYVLDAESDPVDSVPPPALLFPDQSLDAVHAVGLPEVAQARVAEVPDGIVIEPPTPFAVMSTVGGGGGKTFTVTEDEQPARLSTPLIV